MIVDAIEKHINTGIVSTVELENNIIEDAKKEFLIDVESINDINRGIITFESILFLTSTSLNDLHPENSDTDNNNIIKTYLNEVDFYYYRKNIVGLDDFLKIIEKTSEKNENVYTEINEILPEFFSFLEEKN